MTTELLLKDLNRHIDISCVKGSHTRADIDSMLQYAKKYQFIGVFAMPCYTSYIIEQLNGEPFIKPGGVVGFPAGCDTTRSKTEQAKELVHMGCQELDMVMAYGMLKSGAYDYVLEDIKRVVSAGDGLPVKVIIEAPCLNDYEIAKACELSVRAGAAFVKSGTGWAKTPSTVHMIRLMKDTVGERAFIKAAGGIRSLSVIMEMRELGCERFGMGVNSAVSVMKELEAYRQKQT
ncbi:MAG TPA: deoxyribose-phosphate aldolase [Lachnospiraceae bacterium]|nr:deoxyribose-phosphate aldolase [Lachnospiraceae bacterium]